MRDPERIKRILNKVHDEWKTQPDTRLIQLLMNKMPPDVTVADMYYVEDETLEMFLDEKNYHRRNSNID